MWTREYLKSRAKSVLRTSYWKSFLVSIILVIIGGDGGLGSGSRWSSGRSKESNFGPIFNLDSEMLPIIIAAIVGISAVVIIFALGFRVFLGYSLEVGGRRYFVRAAEEDVNISYLGYAFEKGRYLDIIKTMFYKGVLNFLWFLLFIIPGIVKYYAYSMTPYILADNPNIGHNRAVELSKDMTQGQKMDMFILDLSFIGWYILGLIALGVGVLFVKPYENATKAELYIVLRKNALDTGLCSIEELQIN